MPFAAWGLRFGWTQRQVLEDCSVIWLEAISEIERWQAKHKK